VSGSASGGGGGRSSSSGSLAFSVQRNFTASKGRDRDRDRDKDRVNGSYLGISQESRREAAESIETGRRKKAFLRALCRIYLIDFVCLRCEY
jgi:hypothetical protein